MLTNIFSATKTQNVQSRFGLLEARSSKNEFIKDTLFLNEKIILHKDQLYLGIYGLYKFDNADYIVVGANCGGNSCIDELIIVSVDKKGKVIITEDSALQSSDGTLQITKLGNKLLFNLGYDTGKRKQAMFDGSKLVISYEAKKIAPPIPDSDCEWLYDSALDGCITAKNEDPNCRDPENKFSMVLIRNLSPISQHPGFIAYKWSDICKQVCKTGRVPRFEPFKQDFCGIK